MEPRRITPVFEPVVHPREPCHDSPATGHWIRVDHRGAKGFVYGVEYLAAWLGLSTLALSLLIVPVATELPEKVNSIIWVRRAGTLWPLATSPERWCFRGVCCLPWESC